MTWFLLRFHDRDITSSIFFSLSDTAYEALCPVHHKFSLFFFQCGRDRGNVRAACCLGRSYAKKILSICNTGKDFLSGFCSAVSLHQETPAGFYQIINSSSHTYVSSRDFLCCYARFCEVCS